MNNVISTSAGLMLVPEPLDISKWKEEEQLRKILKTRKFLAKINHYGKNNRKKTKR